jgi:hypothetical protein
VDGGTIGNVRGGIIQSVDGGIIQNVNGGTIGNVRGGIIQSVDGGIIQNVNGGTITFYVSARVRVQNSAAVIIDRTAERTRCFVGRTRARFVRVGQQ